MPETIKAEVSFHARFTTNFLAKGFGSKCFYFNNAAFCLVEAIRLLCFHGVLIVPDFIPATYLREILTGNVS